MCMYVKDIRRESYHVYVCYGYHLQINLTAICQCFAAGWHNPVSFTNKTERHLAVPCGRLAYPVSYTNKTYSHLAVLCSRFTYPVSSTIQTDSHLAVICSIFAYPGLLYR